MTDEEIEALEAKVRRFRDIVQALASNLNDTLRRSTDGVTLH